MPTIKDTAQSFFDACETGKGWEGCEDLERRYQPETTRLGVIDVL